MPWFECYLPLLVLAVALVVAFILWMRAEERNLVLREECDTFGFYADQVNEFLSQIYQAGPRCAICGKYMKTSESVAIIAYPGRADQDIYHVHYRHIELRTVARSPLEQRHHTCATQHRLDDISRQLVEDWGNKDTISDATPGLNHDD